MLMRAALFAAAVGGASSGCDKVFGNHDPRPGDVLGTYHVTTGIASNTCGEGALGEQDSWQFDVKLSRDTGALYWNNGQEVINGTLGADGVSFSFDSGIVIDMRT